MVNTIVICPDGHIIPESDCLGRTGEHNATVLRFEFFKDLNGEAVAELEKNLVAVMPEGTLPFRIDGDFYVPRTITLNPEIILFVEIKKGNEVLFKSTPHVFTLIDTGETEGTDIIGAATETVREECRAELAESLETATGESQEGKTWDEMVDTVRDMSIEPFIEPMLDFFEEYDFNFNPDVPDVPIDPDIPVEPYEGGDENVTE